MDDRTLGRPRASLLAESRVLATLRRNPAPPRAPPAPGRPEHTFPVDRLAGGSKSGGLARHSERISNDDCQPYNFSHRALVIPACLRMIFNSVTPMSPPWGFGIVRTRSSFCMNSCRPPEYGPVNPARRKAATSSRRCPAAKKASACLPDPDPHAPERWNVEPLSDADEDPLLDDLLQL